MESRSSEGPAAGGPSPAEGLRYQAPEWSQAPAHPFSFEVIKNGLVLGEIDLSKRDHYIMGRKGDQCDIVLDHPSISRQHAVLQFGKNHRIALVDLGSTHGSKVNKQPIAPKVFHPLHVGDVLQFADSSRLYVLNGPEELLPEEYDSDNLRIHRARAEARAAKREQAEATAKAAKGSEAGPEVKEKETVHVGNDADIIRNMSRYKKIFNIVDEEPVIGEATGDGGAGNAGANGSALLEKGQIDLYNKLQLLEKRKETLEDERVRIENNPEFRFGDASEGGNDKRLARNKKALEKVEQQLEQVKEQLEMEEERDETREISSEYYDDIFDEKDAYFDRAQSFTAKKSASSSDSPVETEDSLKRKLKEIGMKLLKLGKEEEKLQKSSAAAPADVGAADSLESYLKSSEEELRASRLKAIATERCSLQRDKDKYLMILKIVANSHDYARFTQSLLDSVQPVLEEAKVTGSISRAPAPESLSGRMLPPSAAPPPPSVSSARMAPPLSSSSAAPLTSSSKSTLSPESTTAAASQKRMFSASESIVAGSDSSVPFEKDSKKRHAELVQKEEEEEGEEDSFVDWVPPVGQTGDGHTFLNDKYGY